MILIFILPLVASSQRLGSSDEGWGSGGSSPFGFLYSIGFIILVAILINVFESKNEKKEDKKKTIIKKTPEVENRKKINQEQYSRLSNLNGIYEESDILELSSTYLKVPIVKNEYKKLRERENPFKAKNKEDFDSILSINSSIGDNFELIAKPYLLNGEVNIRNEQNEIIEKKHYLKGAKDYSIKYNQKGELRNGKWTTYFDNGNLWLESNYKEGKLHGNWLFYYENGKIQNSKPYKDGKLHGVCYYHEENGDMSANYWENGIEKPLN